LSFKEKLKLKQIHLQKSANPLAAIYTTVLQEQDPKVMRLIVQRSQKGKNYLTLVHHSSQTGHFLERELTAWFSKPVGSSSSFHSPCSFSFSISAFCETKPDTHRDHFQNLPLVPDLAH